MIVINAFGNRQIRSQPGIKTLGSGTGTRWFSFGSSVHDTDPPFPPYSDATSMVWELKSGINRTYLYAPGFGDLAEFMREQVEWYDFSPFLTDHPGRNYNEAYRGTEIDTIDE